MIKVPIPESELIYLSDPLYSWYIYLIKKEGKSNEEANKNYK